MCPSASQPRKNQTGKYQYPKSQSQKSPQVDSAQSYDPSSFSDTFRAMARESLVKNSTILRSWRRHAPHGKRPATANIWS